MWVSNGMESDRAALRALERGEIRPEHYEFLNRHLVDVNADVPQIPSYVAALLPRTNAKGGNDCSICRDPIQVGSKNYKLKCPCENHEHCLTDWFSKGNGSSCPNCRKKIDAEQLCPGMLQLFSPGGSRDESTTPAANVDMPSEGSQDKSMTPFCSIRQ